MLRNLVGLLAVMTALPLSIQAAEWSAEPRASLRTGYNDNIRLASTTHDPVWEAVFSPALKFGTRTETSGLDGDLGLAIRRFTGGSGLDSGDALNREDYHLDINTFHNTLRSRVTGFVNYTRDSTLDSQLDQTGNVINRATRDRLALGPGWTRSLTELTRLDLAYQFSNVKYASDSGLVGYDYHVGSVSLVHQFTERMQGTLAANYSSYRPESSFSSDSDSLSLQAGLSSNLSETMLVTFLIGQRQTTSVFPIGPVEISTDSTSIVYSASLSKQFEAGSLRASLSRASSPGSIGQLLDTTRLAITDSHRLTETLNASLWVEYVENETIVNQGGGAVQNQEKETFFRVTPKLSWQWHREWALAGEYQYVNNDDPVTGTATRNAFYLTLTYQPTKISISR